jgi:tripartite-type tricarboxylate transporter receptor subunit TctC
MLQANVKGNYDRSSFDVPVRVRQTLATSTAALPDTLNRHTNMKRNVIHLCRILRALPLLFAAAMANAQDFPSRPIKIVLGFPPGGATDILSRDFAAKLSEELKQQVIIENRPGAGGTIGADQVAKAAPDGYTLTIGTTSNHAIAQSLYKKLPYDPVKDFAPVTMLAVSQNVVVVNPDVPAKSLRELVDYAKANPGKLNYGSSGNGTISHLTGELFNALNGTQITHIPYKGSAFVFPDLLSGQVSIMYDSTISIQALVKSGKVRALAVTGATRSKQMPDIPTVAESGYPGFVSTNFFGLFAPAATPRDILTRLHAASVKVLAQPDLAERFASQGAEIVANKPEEAMTMLKQDISKWAEVAKKSGAKID